MEPRRCATHGLVATEDGRCVICRRGEVPVTKATSSDLPVVILAGVLGVAVVGVLGYGLTKRIRGFVEHQDPVSVQVAPDPPTTTQVAEPAPTTRTGSRRDFPSFLDASAAVPGNGIGLSEDAALAALEREKRLIPVTMYARGDCQLCDNARLWLKQRGYQLEERDISKSATDKVLLQSLNPAGSVPTFDIAGKVLVGYDRQVLDETLSEIAERKLKKN